MVSHDWRSLRRSPTGQFFLCKAAERRTTLCAGCARPDCTIKPRDACSQFIPTLVFRDQTGLSSPLFNTLRLGNKAASRYLPGDTVALSDGVEVFAFAVVDHVVCVENTVEGLRHVARDNHLLVEQYMDSEPAAHALAAILQRLYGPAVIMNNPQVTAIYLKPKP